MDTKTITNYFTKNPFQALLFSAFVFIILMNYANLQEVNEQIYQIKKIQDHQHIGKIFYGLDKIFKDQASVGYFTDKDLKEPQHNRRFSEAQYVVAPTVLDANNINHQFILFDCLDENIALKKISEVNGTILQKRGGLILVRRKP